MWEDNVRLDLKRNVVGSCGLDLSDSGYSPVSGFHEHANEPTSSIKGMEFLD
jgi:hypothetical protein